jgi:hypothetical protein
MFIVTFVCVGRRRNALELHCREFVGLLMSNDGQFVGSATGVDVPRCRLLAS